MDIMKQFLKVLCILQVLVITTEGVETCFPRLGCFSTDPPFNNTGSLPQDPNFINTMFKLYTRQNRNTPIDLDYNNINVINPDLKIKFIIHGFMQDLTMPWILNAATALLIKEDVNVIVVGWGQGAGFPYQQAASNTRVVGAEVALMINNLINMASLTARKIHLIGHSLGAHIAGYAAQQIIGIDRITGLDPAKPSFSGTDAVVHLDKTDARFVDVIHTDGSPYNTFSGYGMLTAVGHIDFYPNGGSHQPGCGSETYINVMSNYFYHGFSSAEHSMGCSHHRACELFIESINGPCSFTAYPCSSQQEFDLGHCLDCGNRFCPKMGLDADRFKSRGKYYLQTNSRSPYCGNHYYVELTLAPASYSQAGTIKVRLFGNGGETQHLTFISGSTGGSFKKLFFTNINIGSIQGVSVSYSSDEYGSWFRTSRTTIVVKRVIVQSLKRNIRKYFCERRTVKSGGTAIIQDGSRHPC